MSNINYPIKKTYVSGNLEGSGSIISPIVLKDQIEVNAVTSSYMLNGLNVVASGIYSHAEGVSTVAAGEWSHAEGFASISNKAWSHAEGYETFADGIASHAEGYQTTASAGKSHSEGENTLADALASHAEGGSTLAAGNYSHAEGLNTETWGNASHAEGIGTIAISDNQHVQGKWNLTNVEALAIIGNGTEDSARSNILEVYIDKAVISGTFEVTSSITASSLKINNDIIVNGTASINVLNTIEANSLKVGDKYITLMTGANTQADLDNAGILFGSASLGESGEQGSVAHIVYRDSLDKLEIYPGLKVSGSTQIVGNQVVTGSVTITGNLTASNISGTLIGPAGGVLTGTYPNPTGLLCDNSDQIFLYPKNGSNQVKLTAVSGALTIKPTKLSNIQGSTVSIINDPGSTDKGYVSLYSYGAFAATSEGQGAIKSSGLNLDVSASSGQANLGIGNLSKNINDIVIGRTSLPGFTAPRSIMLASSSVPVINYGKDIRISETLTPISSSKIIVNANTICLTPASNITMSAKPAIEASTFFATYSPDGCRVTLINTSTSSICFLNDDSIVPPIWGSTVLSSSLKLGAQQRVLNTWGILELQFQRSGSDFTNGGYWVETNFSNNLTGSTDLSEYALLSGSTITASSLYTNYIDFNTASYGDPNPLPSAQLGRIFYNRDSGDLSTFLDAGGLYLNNGQQLMQKCMNKSGGILSKGTIVHISGSTNNTDTPHINVADWSNDDLSANTLGVVMQDIEINTTGYILTQGVLTGLSLSGLTAPVNGQILYLSSSGTVTNVKPSAPKHTVTLGQLIAKADITNNKTIYVSIQNGYELSELHDVSASLGKLNGDLLAWDSGSSVWKNTKQLSGSYNISGTLSASNLVGDGSGITNIFASVSSSGNLTGSGTSGNPVTLKSNISLTSVTASFSGSLLGTSSYANNADLLDNYHAFQFAITGSNIFIGNQILSGNINFQNGKGIDFGASTGLSSSATLLDDYEEGTWTPQVYGSTNSGSIAVNTLYLSQTGTYTKIGGLVQLTGYISISDLSFPTGVPGVGIEPPQGEVRIALPFISKVKANHRWYNILGYYQNVLNTIIAGATENRIYFVEVFQGQSYLSIRSAPSNVLDCSDLQDNTIFKFSVTYETQ